MTDLQIITALKARDENVFLLVYKNHYGSVTKYIKKTYSITTDVAKDVYQESLIVLWKNTAKAEFNLSSSLNTYLTGIAIRQSLNWIRRNKKLTTIENTFGESNLFNTSDDNTVQVAIVKECVSKLSLTCQELLKLYYFDELSNHQIAEIMHFKNSDSVKTQKCKCMNKLKEIVQQKYRIEDFAPELVYC